ncbi:hypothetical protein Q5752_003338 [Cryptotrichosporon argae]
MLPPSSRFSPTEMLHSIPLAPLAAFLSAPDTSAQLRALNDILDKYRTPKRLLSYRDARCQKLGPAAEESGPTRVTFGTVGGGSEGDESSRRLRRCLPSTPHLYLRTLDAAALFTLETWRSDTLGLPKLDMEHPDSIYYRLPTPERSPTPPIVVKKPEADAESEAELWPDETLADGFDKDDEADPDFISPSPPDGQPRRSQDAAGEAPPAGPSRRTRIADVDIGATAGRRKSAPSMELSTQAEAADPPGRKRNRASLGVTWADGLGIVQSRVWVDLSSEKSVKPTDVKAAPAKATAGQNQTPVKMPASRVGGEDEDEWALLKGM